MVGSVLCDRGPNYFLNHMSQGEKNSVPTLKDILENTKNPKLRKSRIRELENFLLREMESVDICIELVRIREFDSSGGRIEI